MSKATVFRFTKSLNNNIRAYLEEAIEFIGSNVASNENVVCALSGGIDSSVTAEIFRRAIGDRLYPIHIDTGFMRIIKGEEEVNLVKREFKEFNNFEFIDSKDIFHDNIFGLEDAEDKRKAFRSTYEEVLNDEIRKIGSNVMTQGTIRPDIIETESQIKSQNNVKTNFNVEKLVEPLTGLYKPGVRKLAKELGFSRERYLRQPFPGPGLSVRTVGVINDDKLENERIANDIVERFIEDYFEDNYGRKFLWDKITGTRIPFQYFAATLDGKMHEESAINDYLNRLDLNVTAFSLESKATGIIETGEKRERSYYPLVLLRGELEQEIMYYLGKEIPEQFGVSRVLFDLTGSENDSGLIISIRAINSKDAMVAEPLRIPISVLEEAGKEIISKTNSNIIVYDVTPKPPGTIEYE